MSHLVNEPESAATGVARERVLVLDFGSQYAQLIARRVREQNVFCEIVRHDISVERIRQHDPRGLILSGGPSSVYDQNSPHCNPGLFQMGIPVLGICYGMQLACDALGGEVRLLMLHYRSIYRSIYNAPMFRIHRAARRGGGGGHALKCDYASC